MNLVLDVLNMNDYVFIDMTWENACRTLQITGLSLEETVALYKELTSPEEREKYREYKLLKTYERWEAFTNNTAGKLKSFVEKFTRSQNKEQGETLDEESNNPGE